MTGKEVLCDVMFSTAEDSLKHEITLESGKVHVGEHVEVSLISMQDSDDVVVVTTKDGVFSMRANNIGHAHYAQGTLVFILQANSEVIGEFVVNIG